MASVPLLASLHRQFEHWLFDLPESVGGKPLHWLAVPLRFVYALLRDLVKGQLGLRAMSLVYLIAWGGSVATFMAFKAVPRPPEDGDVRLPPLFAPDLPGGRAVGRGVPGAEHGPVGRASLDHRHRLRVDGRDGPEG
jgi:hypothetical protein